MKKVRTIFKSVVITMLLSTAVFANGLSLNSIGTRALAMGGAFIGLSNDGTAIYWNPAGISGQANSIYIAVTDIMPFASYKMPLMGIDAETKTNHYIAPNVFAVYSLGDITLGFGAYVPAGLGAEWDKADFGFEMMSKIGVFNFSPTIAYKISDNVSIGAAVNIAYGMMELKMAQDDGSGTNIQYSEDVTGWGFGASFGMKFKAAENLCLGLSVKTPLKISFDGDVTFGLPMTLERDIEWPWWFGAGIAFMPQENWTITADAQYTNWSSLDQIETVYSFTHPQAGPMTMTQDMELKWDNAIQIRIGTEYQVSDAFAVRCGYYYDPAPSPDETLVVLFPSSTNHVITGGFGYQTGNIRFDLGAEYLIGGEREVAVNATNAMPGTHQMDIFAVSAGFGIGL